MKKRYLSLVVAGICAFALAGCGSSTNSTASASGAETAAVSSTENNTAESEENAKSKEICEKIENYLDDENYADASSYLIELNQEKLAETADDINDYLVEVDLTSDNFDEYFSQERGTAYDEWKREVLGESVALKSLKYDEGLILYKLDDDITLDLTITTTYDDGSTNPYDYEVSLEDWLQYPESAGYYLEGDSKMGTEVSINSMSSGKITFIKEDYVESYEELDSHGTTTTYEIKLKNGEVITRDCYLDYKY